MQNRLGRRLLPLIQVENTLSLRGSVLWLSTTNHPLHSPFPIHPRPPYLTPLLSPFGLETFHTLCVFVNTWIYLHTLCVHVVVCQLFLVWPRRCIERRERKRKKRKKRRLISRRLFFTLAKRRASFSLIKREGEEEIGVLHYTKSSV